MRKIATLSTLLLATHCAIAKPLTAKKTHQAIKKTIRSDYYPYIDVGPYYRQNPFGTLEVDGFLPMWQNPINLVFIDARFLENTNPTNEFNIGLAYRHLFNRKHYILGLFSFYDRKRSQIGNFFNQITSGIEYKNNHWDDSIRTYIPVGRTNFPDSALNNASLVAAGANLFTVSYSPGQEKALYGFDAEMGHNLFSTNLYGYAGFYYFDRSNIKAAYGPRLRLRYDLMRANGKPIFNLFRQVSFDTMVRYDQLYGVNFYVGLRFRFSLGKQANLTGLQRHMEDRIFRDLDVLSGTGNAPKRTLKNSDGTSVTVSTPTTAAGLQSNSANVIAVWRSITGVNSFTLQNNQKLIGGNYTFTTGGQTFTIAASGSGSLTAASGQNLVTLGQNNTIENITLDLNSADTTNEARTIIRDNSNAAVGSLNINNLTGNGRIRVNTTSGTSNINIQNNTLTNAAVPMDDDNVGAIAIISGGTANVTVSNLNNNTITATGDGNATILLRNSNANSSFTLSNGIKDNTLTTSGDDAVGIAAQILAGTFTSQGDISGNTFTQSSAGSSGIFVQQTSGTGTLTNINNNTFTATGNESIGITMDIAGSGASLTMSGKISGNTISATATDSNGINIAVGDSGGDTLGSLDIQQGINNNTITANKSGITIGASTSNTVDITGLNNNTINFSGARGDDAAGIDVANGSAGTVTITNLNSNTITFTPSSGNATAIQLGASGNSTTTITGLNNNVITFNTSGSKYGVNIDSALAGDTVNVTVQDGSNGISAANGSVTVNTAGSGSINATPGL
ncbi:MAG: hypothetical protein K0U12_05830 [Gammaproteobacteria bacterium]|nr:hypothetical protein [Gammaproteobacteria bacterium]